MLSYQECYLVLSPFIKPNKEEQGNLENTFGKVV